MYRCKTQIANELGMTRSNLYQMFPVKNLSPDTRKKFEDYFNERIFIDKPVQPVQKESIINDSGNDYKSNKSRPVTEADVIVMLNKHIETLEKHYAWLQKMYEEQKEKTDANLQIALENQKFQIRQLGVISHLQAEYYSDGDAKKFSEELKKIDMLVTAGM
jgi:hypothetical protein